MRNFLKNGQFDLQSTHSRHGNLFLNISQQILPVPLSVPKKVRLITIIQA